LRWRDYFRRRSSQTGGGCKPDIIVIGALRKFPCRDIDPFGRALARKWCRLAHWSRRRPARLATYAGNL
jgi:hypothetical protein